MVFRKDGSETMEVNEIPAHHVPPKEPIRGLPLGRFVAVTSFLVYLEQRGASITFPHPTGTISIEEGYMTILGDYITYWKDGGGLHDVNPE